MKGMNPAEELQNVREMVLGEGPAWDIQGDPRSWDSNLDGCP